MHGFITHSDTKSHDKILSIMTQATNKKKIQPLQPFGLYQLDWFLLKKQFFHYDTAYFFLYQAASLVLQQPHWDMGGGGSNSTTGSYLTYLLSYLIDKTKCYSILLCQSIIIYFFSLRSCMAYLSDALTSGPVNPHLTPGPGIYFNAFIHIYSPRAGADNPFGTNDDVNRKPLSLCPLVASLRKEIWFYTHF